MPFDFEKAALIASGVTDEDRIDRYMDRLREIYQSFARQVKISRDITATTKNLFAWLWNGKPSRYKRHGEFRLSRVIENQTGSDDRAVGNCLGLTLLYNCILRKTGIHPHAIYMAHAFGIGPHVLTLLRIEHEDIDIEHVFAHGFDYQGHKDKAGRTVWGDRELVGEIYHSRGNAFFGQGRLSEALIQYDLANGLNPHHEVLHLNKLILLDKMKKEKIHISIPKFLNS